MPDHQLPAQGGHPADQAPPSGRAGEPRADRGHPDPRAPELARELEARLAEAQAEIAALRLRCEEEAAARRERARSEERFRRLYHDTPVMLHSIDRNGLITDVSNYWLDTLGYRREEVVGRKSTEFLTEESRRYAESVVLPEFFRTGFCRNIQYQVESKGGAVIDVLLAATAERDADGSILRSLAVMTDVTEWKAAQRALRASEERYRMIVETSREGILAADQEGRLNYANRQFAELLGYEVSELLGRPFLDFVDPCLHDEIARKQSSRREGVSEHYETILMRRDGTRVHASVSAIPVRGGSGEFGGSFAMVSDVTRRKLAAEEIEVLHTHLSARAHELELANEDLEAFGYTVSHDLRKPLTAINGYSQVILELFGNDLDPQCRQYVEEILQGSVKMNQLIDTLLNFSRRGGGDFAKQSVNLSAIVDDICGDLSRAEPARRATFLVQAGVRAEGDAHLLRVALDNLLGNAWKYSARKGQTLIEFGVTRQQGEQVFFVRDNGAGFAAELAPLMFKPFQRLHDANDFQGTGIGLASVQRIIQRHGGRIWAEGRPGEGATFYFTLG